MELINRINLSANTTDTIAVFDSETTRWLKANNCVVSDSMLKINSIVPTKNFDLEADYAYMKLLQYANSGYPLNNKVYVPLVAAASDTRKGQATWFDRTIAPKYWRWAMCGLDLIKISGKIAIKKYMAYLGLLSSASKKFKEVFGIEIDVDRIAVIDDANVKVTGIMDVVYEDGTIEHAVEREIEINAFDGYGVIRDALTNGESVTIRGPWIKAFVQAANWAELTAYGLKTNGNNEFRTLYGKRNMKDVDIILTKSCFKAAGLYETWEQYAKAFKELGHNICVCVREHAPKLKGLPYQQGQTLMGDDSDVEKFAQHSLATVSKYEDKKEAAKLLPQWQKAVAKIWPNLLKEGHTARTIQEKYTSKKAQMLGGRIPELGYNAFIAPDMKAFAEHLFGQKIVGSLKAGECFCSNCEPGVVDITRNPHLDNAHVLLMNVDKMEFVSKKSPTMFINIWDLTTIRLRCDYDGDHVWYSQNVNLLALVNKSYEVLHNLPVDWVAPKAPKGIVNKATVAEFIANLLKGSEIGLYADALTKMWANGYDRDVCDWLTYAGNVLIDAAKHGNVKIVKPDDVKAIDGKSLPEFCRYAKADKDHPADSKYWTEERFVCVDEKKDEKTVYASEYNEKKHGKIKTVLKPRTQYSGSFLDKYSRRVKELVPDTLKINGIDDLVFDYSVMLIKPDRKAMKLGGLCLKASNYNQETGKYEEEGGVFQKIAFRHAEEWKTLINQDGFKMNHLEWEEAKKNDAIREMVAWARAQYADNPKAQEASDETILDAVYDIVTRRVFYAKMSEGMDTVIKSAYWRIFGEKCFEVVRNNLKGKLEEEALNFNPVIDDDDDDDDLY